MQVLKLLATKDWVLVEFTNPHTSCLERKYIPRDYVSEPSLKGPTILNDDLAMMGVDYCNADVESVLGEAKINSDIACEVHDAFRRSGFWCVTDYERNPMGVLRKLKNFKLTMDTQVFINELRRRIVT